MKKYVLLLACLLPLTSVQAQRTSSRTAIHEIRLGYGMLTSDGILNGATQMLDPVVGTDITYGGESHSGCFYLSYRARLLPKFRLGATFAYDKVSKDYIYRLPDEGMRLFSTPGKNHFLTVTADAQFSYLQSESGVLSLYWSVSAGVSFHKQRLEGLNEYDRSRTRFAYQVSPLGVTVGAKQLGAFAELGFGYRGVLQLGIYARF